MLGWGAGFGLVIVPPLGIVRGVGGEMAALGLLPPAMMKLNRALGDEELPESNFSGCEPPVGL